MSNFSKYQIKVCPVCQGEYVPTNSTQVICSSICRDNDRHARANQKWANTETKEWKRKNSIFNNCVKNISKENQHD